MYDSGDGLHRINPRICFQYRRAREQNIVLQVNVRLGLNRVRKAQGRRSLNPSSNRGRPRRAAPTVRSEDLNFLSGGDEHVRREFHLVVGEVIFDGVLYFICNLSLLECGQLGELFAERV